MPITIPQISSPPSPCPTDGYVVRICENWPAGSGHIPPLGYALPITGFDAVLPLAIAVGLLIVGLVVIIALRLRRDRKAVTE